MDEETEAHESETIYSRSEPGLFNSRGHTLRLFLSSYTVPPVLPAVFSSSFIIHTKGLQGGEMGVKETNSGRREVGIGREKRNQDGRHPQEE